MDYKKVVNLCPHEIIYQYENGNRICIKPTGYIANCGIVNNNYCEVRDGKKILIKSYTDLLLPKERNDTLYIVSKYVFLGSDRKDLLLPYDKIINKKTKKTEAVTSFLGKGGMKCTVQIAGN